MGQIKDKAAKAVASAQALGGECNRIFLELNEARILADAAALDASRAANEGLPLYGLTVSLKDLFDEAGKRTTAGSKVLANVQPARHDAEVVARLKAAGALMFGRTNMSEFAYSGVGINPHHGTPGCVFDITRLPGGSSSGAALSVAHGFCDIAMGTDTGGSVRLPAALNGLYGFKPSQQTVSLTGVHPLSPSYDSVGPLAKTIELVIACLNVIRAEPLSLNVSERPLKLVVPTDAFTDDLDKSVALAFRQSVETLKKAGQEIHRVSFGELVELASAVRLTVSAQGQAFYRDYMHRLETEGDPNVLARLHQSDGMTESDIAEQQARRDKAISLFNERMAGFDALLSPTVKCETPSIAETEADFNAVNGAMLRNTTYINLINGCGMTLPVQRDGMSPAALMVCGPNGADNSVISASMLIDQLLTPQ